MLRVESISLLSPEGLQPGDIVCSRVILYASSQRSNQFDGAFFGLRACLQLLGIIHNVEYIDSMDIFGKHLPVLRVENKVFVREEFYSVITQLLGRFDKQRTHIVRKAEELSEIVDYLQYFDASTKSGNRDAYNWLLSPVKKIAYRWEKRTLSAYYEEKKGYNSRRKLRSDIILVLERFSEIFELSNFVSISGQPVGDDLTQANAIDVVIAGVVHSLDSLETSAEIREDIERNEHFSKLREFAKDLVNRIKENEDGTKLAKNVIILKNFNTSTKAEDGQAKNKPIKELVNNISVNATALLLFGMILFKFTPIKTSK